MFGTRPGRKTGIIRNSCWFHFIFSFLVLLCLRGIRNFPVTGEHVIVAILEDLTVYLLFIFYLSFRATFRWSKPMFVANKKVPLYFYSFLHLMKGNRPINLCLPFYLFLQVPNTGFLEKFIHCWGEINPHENVPGNHC